MKNFIKTSNGEVAQRMVASGYTVINCSDGFWTFLNEEKPKLRFDAEDKKHLIYTDVIFL